MVKLKQNILDMNKTKLHINQNQRNLQAIKKNMEC